MSVKAAALKQTRKKKADDAMKMEALRVAREKGQQSRKKKSTARKAEDTSKVSKLYI